MKLSDPAAWKGFGKPVAAGAGRQRADHPARAALRMLLCALAATLLVSLTVDRAGAEATAKDTEACLNLSFAPLDLTIPACGKIIDSGDLEDRALYEALVARAEAWAWAMTYNFGHEVEPGFLLESRLADLDRAVGVARRLAAAEDFTAGLQGALAGRASAYYLLGDHDRAVQDYSEAIGLGGTPEFMDLFGRSLAYQQSGRLDLAIDDMSSILRTWPGDSNLANSFVRRAELHEAAGDTDAALTDYRHALDFDPGHTVANRALERLAAGE